MNNNNFKWLVNDIYNSIVMKLYHNDGDNVNLCGTYEVLGVLNTTGDELDIEFANIDDMTKLLTMGIVRFISVNDISDIIDIPFRNMYKLYKNSDDNLNINDLEAFAIFDGALIKNNYYIVVCLVNEVSFELNKLIEVAQNFGTLGMQEKFDALTEINMINYKRMQSDNKIR